jgi:hypothetical protein
VTKVEKKDAQRAELKRVDIASIYPTGDTSGLEA